MRKTEYNVSVVSDYCKPKGKQKQLADQIGVSPSAISRLRNNKHKYIDDMTYDKLDNVFSFNEIVKSQYERDMLKAFRRLPEHMRSMVLACLQSGNPSCDKGRGGGGVEYPTNGSSAPRSRMDEPRSISPSKHLPPGAGRKIVLED